MKVTIRHPRSYWRGLRALLRLNSVPEEPGPVAKVTTCPSVGVSAALKYMFSSPGRLDGWQLVTQGRGGDVLYRSESKTEWFYVAYNAQTGEKRTFPVPDRTLLRAMESKMSYEAFLQRELDRICGALDQ